MGAEKIALSEFETKVLHALQYQFPLEERPYQRIADSLQVAEKTVIDCVGRLHQKGLIRRLGASINSRQIGYVSMLVAAKVAEESIEEVATLVNSFVEVTHNYLREGEYNMWFTVIAPDQRRLGEILDKIGSARGTGTLLRLPAKKVFKVSVKFPMAVG
jgi:DNA-binding Lrp family transcriptional regulator